MKYLIQFTPLCPYFFGGEQTFGEGNKEVTNYFAKSNFMPQQSTILGAIRFRILQEHKLLNYSDDAKQDVRRWIGEQGFAIPQKLDALNQTADYGCIKQLSPVFIHHKQSYYTPMPLNFGYEHQRLDVKGYFSGIERDTVLNFPTFNPKKYDNHKHWVNADGKKLSDVLHGDMYTVKTQIGIVKDKSADSEKDAFFKQDLIQLHPELSFACVLETFHDKELESSSSVVFMGANRSAFMMKVCECPKMLEWMISGASEYFRGLKQSDDYKILLSDAFITEDLKNAADFIWGQSINFRCIVNKVSSGHSWCKPNKSALYHLLPAGSVIYGKSDVITKELEKPLLQQVGLNIFI